MSHSHSIRTTILVATALAVTAACNRDEKPGSAAKKPEEKLSPSLVMPGPPPQYTGTPYWLIQSANWPPVMEWTLGPDDEHEQDSVFLRLTGLLVQDYLGGENAKEHPLVSSFYLTVRPIPFKMSTSAFLIDSVQFFDPIRQKRFKPLPMLSMERHTEAGTVRTEFSNNYARSISPELTDGQLLEPTVYLTSVAKKTLVIKMEPIPIRIVREIEPEGPSQDSLKWGPS